MNYWILWPVGIAAWLLLGWAEFGVIEGRALSAKAKPNQITLSMLVYTVASKFPLALATACLALGYFWGALLTHFLWHWCPPGSISAG
jgi:hypothetical protein